MSGGNYMGAAQANALVGKWFQVVGASPWQQIVGADVKVRRAAEYAQERHGWGGYRHHHRHHHHYGQQQPYYGAPAPYAGVPVWNPYTNAYMRAPAYPDRPLPGPAYVPYGQLRDHRRTWMGADPAQSSAVSIPPRNALIDAPGPERAGREILPMSSGEALDTGESAQITARPQRVAFRPERVFIGGGGTENGAADWIVNDIKIGNRSQFSQAGDIPGDIFANTSIDSFVSFETAQTAMDVVMVVTYIGLSQGGAAFYGAIIGTAAV